MRLYFSYGSNMDRTHMARLCRGAQSLGVGHAENHVFFIADSGYASIVPKRNSRVYGVLWRISAQDLLKLDTYESVGSGLYRPVAIPVHLGGKFLRAMVYYAVEPKPGRPKPGYQEKLVAAARSWNFPEDYVLMLEKFLPHGHAVD
jgi:gamma-glutamylcyclotransferase (GGCT)/AIG2-like uncharacterized protein YtfP